MPGVPRFVIAAALAGLAAAAPAQSGPTQTEPTQTEPAQDGPPLTAQVREQVAMLGTAIDFRTPDGTRFVLLPTDGPPLVHWAVATPTGPLVDPPAAPGLAAACALASMRGTWTVGSLDAERERQALQDLDAAQVDLLRAPRGPDGSASPELLERTRQLQEVAATLADPMAFRRVLIAAPVQAPRVDLRGDVAVLTMTTAPFAIEQVAGLLLDRREHQALRGYRDDYATVQQEAAARWDGDDLAPLRAEIMALAYPGSAIARAGDRPTASGITRALAETAWAQSQHPNRTVHVLTGNFDAAAARAALTAAFARTSLPALAALPAATLRPVQAMRRAIVPGARYPAAIVAWPLRGNEDAATLRTLAQWLAGGTDSWLLRALTKAGRKDVRIVGRAPWPEAAAAGMLIVEVSDLGNGPADLAQQVLKLCATAAARRPAQNELSAAHGEVLARWNRATRTPAELAAHFATVLLEQPTVKLPLLPPALPDLAEVPQLLGGILGGEPIVVEWRDS